MEITRTALVNPSNSTELIGNLFDFYRRFLRELKLCLVIWYIIPYELPS
jgi:hypothetical protein